MPSSLYIALNKLPKKNGDIKGRFDQWASMIYDAHCIAIENNQYRISNLLLAASNSCIEKTSKNWFLVTEELIYLAIQEWNSLSSNKISI